MSKGYHNKSAQQSLLDDPPNDEPAFQPLTPSSLEAGNADEADLPDNKNDVYNDYNNDDNDNENDSNSGGDIDIENLPQLTVVVTGASGFVASHVIKQLLECKTINYRVIGTVRSDPQANFSKYRWLYELNKNNINDKNKLKLYKADLLKSGDFDDIIVKNNPDYVLHIASPYIIDVQDPTRDLLKPAMKGTEHLLHACKKCWFHHQSISTINLINNETIKQNELKNNGNKNGNKKTIETIDKSNNTHNKPNNSNNNNKTKLDSNFDINILNDDHNLESMNKCNLKRVIITSSVAALSNKPNGKITEKNWNMEAGLNNNPYYYSKSQSEQFVWKWAFEHGMTIQNWDQLKLIEGEIRMASQMQSKQRILNNYEKIGFDIVTIQPSMVIGRELRHTQHPNSSNQVLADIINGRFPMKLAMSWQFVDVKDVARAHIFLMSNEDAYGRYIVGGATYTLDMLLNRVILPICDREHIIEHTPWWPCDCVCCFPFVWCASWGQPKGVGDIIRTHVNTVPQYDTSRIEKLGFKFSNVSKALDDTILWLLESNVIKIE